MVSTLCGESGGTSKPIDFAEVVGDRTERARKCEDAGALAGRHRKAREDLGRIGEFVERIHHGDARMRDQRAHHLVVAGKRAGMGTRRLLGARAAPGMHHDDRFAGAPRALGSSQEFGRPADMLDIDHDRAGGAVIGEILDEVHQIEAGLVAGRDRVGRRQIAAFERLAQMAHETAALRDHGQRRIALACNARHHRRMGEPGGEAIDIVGVAEAIGAEHRHIAGARHGGKLVLRRAQVLADFREARGEDHRRPHLAAHAAGERLLHAGGRQGEDREVDAFGEFVDALAHWTAVDLARRGRRDERRPHSC